MIDKFIVLLRDIFNAAWRMVLVIGAWSIFCSAIGLEWKGSAIVFLLLLFAGAVLMEGWSR